jgi:hypothetical protein
MDKFDRIFHLHAVLAARRMPIPLEDLTARLECSKATLYRAIAVLRDTLHAPVEFFWPENADMFSAAFAAEAHCEVCLDRVMFKA